MAGTANLNQPDASPSSSRSVSPTSRRIQATKSYETLSVHPLGNTEEQHEQASVVSSSAATQRTPYSINYKPRQRPPSTGSISLPQTSATTVPATPVSPSSVTTKLQMQSLQATAQKAGLGQDSTGWAIIQRLTGELDEDWEIVVTALKSGKAALLLPKETGHDITPKLMKDHIILKDGQNCSTLSGVRGTKTGSSISFTSVVSSGDISVSSIMELVPVATPAEAEPGQPSITIGYELELQIPRQTPLQTSTPVKTTKPVPKRSLASLFGGQRPPAVGSPDNSPRNPALGPEALGLAPSPAAVPSTMVSCPAFVIDKVLSRKKLVKAVQSSFDTRTKEALQDIDENLSRMVLHFLRRFQPTFKQLSGISPTTETDSGNITADGSLVNADISTITSALQELWYDIRLRLEEAAQEKLAGGDASLEKGDEKLEGTDPGIGVDADLEKVEAFVCEMLYDKIFSPPTATDRRDDESLATRIAGLHMLDLTLDHLGLQVEASGGGPAEWDDERKALREGLEDITRTCGDYFTRLNEPACRSPAAKLQILVQVHKTIVDSLEQLPAVPLKQDQASERPASRSNSIVEYELSDDTKSLGGRSSLGLAIAEEDIQNAERTPRMPTSRPLSTYSNDLPSIRLPEASLQDSYGLKASRDFVEDDAEAPTSDSPSVKKASKASQISTDVPKKQSSTSADAILPLLIYSVVQANPSHLVSHLSYIQRFRADSLIRGEGEYCLCNMDAVRAFLMSCDLGTLGLGTDRIMTSPDLSSQAPRRRHRAADMVGSAGKVLGQAADLGLGGYRILGGLLTRTSVATEAARQPQTIEEVQSVLAGGTSKPTSLRDTILRRSTLSSVVPSLRTNESDEIKETEMLDAPHQLNNETKASNMETTLSNDSNMSVSNTSISSRLAALPGLSRLGGSPALDRGAPPSGKQGGLFSAFTSSPLLPSSSASSQKSIEGPTSPTTAIRPTSPPPLLPPRPSAIRAVPNLFLQQQDTAVTGTDILPPIQRFLKCEAEELRLGDVALLLSDYKRLAGILQHKQ